MLVIKNLKINILFYLYLIKDSLFNWRILIYLILILCMIYVSFDIFIGCTLVLYVADMIRSSVVLYEADESFINHYVPLPLLFRLIFRYNADIVFILNKSIVIYKCGHYLYRNNIIDGSYLQSPIGIASLTDDVMIRRRIHLPKIENIKVKKNEA